jgi:hypothetical protein
MPNHHARNRATKTCSVTATIQIVWDAILVLIDILSYVVVPSVFKSIFDSPKILLHIIVAVEWHYFVCLISGPKV